MAESRELDSRELCPVQRLFGGDVRQPASTDHYLFVLSLKTLQMSRDRHRRLTGLSGRL